MPRDGRYDAGAGMRRSGDARDGRYDAGAGMRMSGVAGAIRAFVLMCGAPQVHGCTRAVLLELYDA